MEVLRAALRGEPGVTLDMAALDLATIERPGFDPAPYCQTLDRIASELATRAGSMRGAGFVRIANQYLFEDLGFHGNVAKYNDPRNSCLDFVLDQKTGIPITLSVLYLEVARRLRMPVFGIGLPGHFVVQYDDDEYSTFLSPFHGGQLITESECRQMARKVTGPDAMIDPAVLAPVDTRYILVRMLNNLRLAYFGIRRYAHAIAVMDLLVEAFPENADYYKSRGVARLRLRELGAAKRDLELYLRFAPEAKDRAEVTKQVEEIHRWLGRLN